MEKTNDMLLNIMANQEFALRDFQSVGLTADNTTLLNEEQYKASDKITSNPLFLNELGNFDENKFHQFYLAAGMMYNNLASLDYNKTILKDAKFSKDNMWVKPDKRQLDFSPRLTKTPNTYLVTNSLTNLGKRGRLTLSISEIAQSQLIYDSETGTWKDSPNDAFWENFTNTLVLATYDEDELDELGNKIHSKGDLKLNDDDLPYYETLGGRSVAGKQVLNKMNVLTTDGSVANKFDFFDSDGIAEKNLGASILKNTVLVGSMFLPYVGPAIAGLSVAALTIGVLGTLGKIITGSDNATFNNMEGWAKTVNRQAQTDYATKNTWCGENIFNMIGDTIGQLAEQRWLFKAVPSIVYGKDAYKAMSGKGREELIAKYTEQLGKKTNQLKVNELIAEIQSGKYAGTTVTDINNYVSKLNALNEGKAIAQVDDLISKASKIGSPLSKAYMTAITVQDTYGEAKEAGASDLEATLLTLGYAAGEAAILNSEIGSWILPEARGDKFRAKAIANALTKDVRSAYNELAQTGSKSTFAKKVMGLGKKLADIDYGRYTGGLGSGALAILANAGSESFEEVSEELLADVSKSVFNAVRWMQGKEGLDMGQWEDMGSRYTMSALGGFLGGGITSAGTDFVVAKNLASMDKTLAMQELLYIVNNGKENEFLKNINSLNLGNKNLSASQIIGKDPNGATLYALGTESDNQDAEIKKLVANLVGLIKNILDSEGAKISTDSLINKLILEDSEKNVINSFKLGNLRNSASLGLYLLDFQNIQSDIVATKSAILDLDAKSADGTTPSLEDLDLRQLLNTKLQGLRIKKDAYIKGHTAGDFVRDALFEMNPVLSDFAVKANLNRFAKYKYGRDFNDLTKTELQTATEEFENYKKTDLKNDIHQLAAHFLDMMENSSPIVLGYIQTIKAMGDSHKIVELTLKNLAITLAQLASFDPEGDPESIIAVMQDMISQNELTAETELAKSVLTTDQITRISNILSAPITGTTEEEIALQKLEKLDNYRQALNEELMNSFDGIAQPFIELGFIHPETKKLLLSISKSIKDVATNLAGYGSAGTFAAASAINILNKEKEIKKLSNTPILKWISEYQSAATNAAVNLQEHWNATINNFENAKLGLDDFSVDDTWQENNEEAKLLIDSFEAVITGMRNDNADFNNPTGYSKMLNSVYRLAGIKNYTPLAEIDAADADLVLEDVRMLKDRFAFAETLNAINRGLKLKTQLRVGINQNYLIFKGLTNLCTAINAGGFDKWTGTDELMSAIDELKIPSEKNLKLNDLERLEQETLLLKVQNSIYEFFNKNKEANGRINQDKLEQFISGLMTDKGYFENTGDLMTESSTYMDKNALLWWIAARGALKATEFNKAYKKSLSDKIAPISSLELATYLGVASIVNMDFMNDFVLAYRNSAVKMFNNKTEAQRVELLKDSGYGEVGDPKKSSYDNVYAKKLLKYFAGIDALPQYNNLIFIEGAPGTGKSGGVYASVKAVIDLLDPEYLKDAFYVHATQSSADKAALKLGFSGKTFGKTEFMKHLSSEWKDARKNKLDVTINGTTTKESVLYDNSYEIADGRVQNIWKLNKYTDAPKVIFLDEISHYNELELSMISQWAAEHQVVVLGAGDLDLDSNTACIKVDGEWLSVGSARNKFIRSQKLGVSLRDHNAQLSKSIANIQAAITNKRHNTPIKDLNLSYYEDEKGAHPGLYGVKVQSVSNKDYSDLDIELLDKTIQLMLNTREDKALKIGYIYHDTNSKLYKHIMSKYSADIDPYYGSDAQGLEGQYYIVENNRDETLTDEMSYLRSLYTGVSRAELAALVIAPGTFGSITSIASIPDKAYQLESIGPKAIEREYRKKEALLERLLEDEEDSINIEFKLPEKVVYTGGVAPITSPSGSSSGSSSGTSGTTSPGFPPVVPAPAPKVINRINFGFNDSEAANNELQSFLARLSAIGALDTIEVTNNTDNKKYTISNPELINEEVSGETIYTPQFTLTSVDDGSVINASVLELNSNYTISSASAGVMLAYLPGQKMTINEGSGDSNIVINNVLSGPPIQYEITDIDGSNPRTVSLEDLQRYYVSDFVEPVAVEETSETGLENDEEELAAAIEGAGVMPEPRKPSAPAVSGDFVHELYSAMSFEMGVWRLDDGKIKFDGPVEKFYARIDNGIGLSKLLRTDNYDTIEDELAYLKNEINNNTNNANLADIFKRRLGLTGDVKIDYVLRTTAGRRNNTDPNFDIYDLGDSEEFKHSLMDDKSSSKQKLMAVISQDGHNVLALTIASLDSPETLLKMEDADGNKIFAELYNKWQSGLTAGLNNNDALEAVYKEYKEHKQFADIANRIRMWQFTSNGVIYLPKDFNVATSMNPTAPILSTQKGKWDEKHGRWEPALVTINDLLKFNKLLKASSMMMSKDGKVNGKIIDGLLKGKPFVLITADNSLNTDSAIVNYFKKLLDRKVPPKVTLAYIKMPSEKPSAWVKNLYEILHKEGGVHNLGNEFTGYRIILALVHAGKMADINSSDGDTETINDLTKAIQEMEAIEYKWNQNDIAFKDDSERQSYEDAVVDYGEALARKYMMGIELKAKLRSEMESNSPSIPKGFTYRMAFQSFLLHSLDPFSPTTKSEADRLNLIDLVCDAAGITNIVYSAQYGTDTVEGTFAKIKANPTNKYQIETLNGYKDAEITAKIDTPQYNTSALNGTIAAFAKHVFFDKSTRVWRMDTWLTRKYEDRYLGVKPSSGRASLTIGEQIGAKYKHYFDAGELNSDILNLDISEVTMMGLLIEDYNKKSGNLGFVHNGQMVLTKLPNPNWKVTIPTRTDLRNTLFVTDSTTSSTFEIEILQDFNADGTIRELNARCTHYQTVGNPASGSTPSFNVVDTEFNLLALNYKAVYDIVSGDRKKLRLLGSAYGTYGKLLRGELTSSCDPDKSVFENFISIMQNDLSVDKSGLEEMFTNMKNLNIDGVDATLLEAVHKDGETLLNKLNGVGGLEINVLDEILYNGNIYTVIGVNPSELLIVDINDNLVPPISRTEDILKIIRDCAKQKINLI